MKEWGTTNLQINVSYSDLDVRSCDTNLASAFSAVVANFVSKRPLKSILVVSKAPQRETFTTELQRVPEPTPNLHSLLLWHSVFPHIASCRSLYPQRKASV